MGRKLQDTLRAHGADVHGCYAIALGTKPDVRGEVLLRMWVQPGGAVGRVDVLKDQTDSGKLTDCLTDAIKHWQVPELAGSDTEQIVFPLSFKPDSSTEKSSAGGPLVHLADGKPGPMAGGHIEARVLIAPSTVGETRVSLVRLVLKPSQRLALHRHPGALELLYVIRGMARVRDGYDPAPVEAQAGDVIAIPSGAAHSIEAAPLAPLELVQLFAPGGVEGAYLNPRDPKARALTLPAKKERLADGAKPDPAKQPHILAAASLKALPVGFPGGGKGEALLYLDGSLVKDVALERLEAPPGATVPMHQHDGSDEVLYFLAGKADVTVGKDHFAIAPGDALRIPQATQHGLTVQPGEKLVAVQCYAPAGPEQRFKQAPTPTEKKP